MESPITGLIRIGEFDEENESIPGDRNDVIRRLALDDRDEQFLVWWLSPHHDLQYSARRVSSDVVVEEFDLSVFPRPDVAVPPSWVRTVPEWVGDAPPYEISQDEVITFVLTQLKQIEDSVTGMFVDRRAITEEIDMDAVVLGGDEFIAIRPDMLLIQAEFADRHPELASWERRSYGRLAAFDSTGLLFRH